MKGRTFSAAGWRSALSLVSLLLVPASSSAMEGKVGLHLARMVPSGADAER